ncbi:beta-lactamase family protein [Akkermansiaceae bacterium]|nr:beta-lactamase family protein [Akkermansiaceae bacterium]MDB4288081.1 beta-lactamase family protein [bacterium]MDA7519171.1 beta-lactamase family protein [Akkermansiaceae bacterium]MDB4041692.1 beta-lactamase family protein [Akkermansiaceae bacterium]MDB4301691.1 beta-lactamase family protein [Akkermansiaceae bacterium]
MKIILAYWMIVGLVFAELQETLDTQVGKNGTPGMAVIVFDQDKIITELVSGVRQEGKRPAIEKRDPWHIGSDGKAMTATLMARLVDKGLVKWDSPLSEIFPKESKKFHPDARAITVEQLLSHTAGVPANVDRDLVLEGQELGAKRIEKQRLEVMEVTLKEAPASEPGSKYLYSNTGYIIVGAVIEKLLDTPFEKAIVREVFGPLGMKSAGFGAPDGKSPRGHVVEGGKRLASPKGYEGDNPAIYAPAGGMHFSLEDWAKFGQAHLKGEGLLKPETFAKLHKVNLNNYALGWLVRVKDGKTVRLGHDGSNTIWRARITLDLERGRGVCVVANDNDDATVQGVGVVEKEALGQ